MESLRFANLEFRIYYLVTFVIFDLLTRPGRIMGVAKGTALPGLLFAICNQLTLRLRYCPSKVRRYGCHLKFPAFHHEYYAYFLDAVITRKSVDVDDSQ